MALVDYKDRIRGHLTAPEQLERLYRQAVRKGEGRAFGAAMDALYAEMPDNLLLAAWHHRLAAESISGPARMGRSWLWAALLGIPLGLVFWWLSDFERYRVRFDLPWLLFVWAPLTALFVLAFLSIAGQRRLRRLALILAGLTLLIAYAYFAEGLIYDVTFKRQYLLLGAIHLVLASWAAVGFYVLAGQGDPESRFAYLAKSLETVVMGGLSLITLAIFSLITMGLFDALGISLGDKSMRLLGFGGAGLIPVLAVAAVYDPPLPMREQDFRTGLGRFIATLLYLFLPLAIVVLLVYIGLIPFHFKEPFYRREVLIIYNVMLFAVIGLLLGVTPAVPEALSAAARRWLRLGMMVLTASAEVISLYALAAIAFRTWWDGFTPNRITVIGWNLINIGLLGLMLYHQWRGGDGGWVEGTRRTFAQATWPYLAWGAFLLLGLPWLF
jgi:hypothetical protein